MGKSDQDKAAENLNNQLGGFNNQLQGLDVKTKNRFDNYQQPFSYGNKVDALDKFYNQYAGDISRTASADSMNAGRGTASRLASQGITGGSILNDAVTGAQGQVNKNKFNSLSQLKAARLGQNASLMGQENADKMNVTQQAQNVDLQNIMNNLQKMGLISGNYGQQGANIQNLDDGSTFDDIMGIVSTVGSIATAPLTGGTSLAGMLLGGGGGGKASRAR